MSLLWNVTVVEKNNRTIHLKITAISPDSGFLADDPVFLMALLTEQAYQQNSAGIWEPIAPLGKAFTYQNSYTISILSEHYRDYIESYQIRSAQDLSLDKRARRLTGSSARNKYIWDQEWAALYQVTVSDSKWIEHLSEGDQFDSAAWSDGPYIKVEVKPAF